MVSALAFSITLSKVILLTWDRLMDALGIIMSIAGPMKQWKVWSVRTMKERLAVSRNHSA
jgi:hypothetical protein